MDFRIDMIPNYRVAYVRQVGPYGPSNAQAMESIKQWARANGLLTDSAILFGIPQDHPAMTLPEHCRYDACLVLSANHPTDSASAVHEGDFDGGAYAICPVEHTAEAVQQAWSAIYQLDLHAQGYRIDTTKPVFERYTGAMIRNEACELCVPIKHLTED